MVIGFCIGGPMIWNLLKRAPGRVAAAVLAQPSGLRTEEPDRAYAGNMKGWGPQLVSRRTDITMEMVDQFLTKMYRNTDFVYTVTRDFVRKCPTPVLILPDDLPPHPYAVAMETAMLAPNAEVSMFPWLEPVERIPLAVRQVDPSSERIDPIRDFAYNNVHAQTPADQRLGVTGTVDVWQSGRWIATVADCIKIEFAADAHISETASIVGRSECRITGVTQQSQLSTRRGRFTPRFSERELSFARA